MPAATRSTTETLTELLTHLVRMPTITGDQATNSAAIDWVQEQLEGLPLAVKRLRHNGFPALIATTRNTRNPKLWLAGHMDVVAAPAELFNPKVSHGRMTGRGAYDMKPALAVFIKLLCELGQDLPKYDLGLMITSDEEQSGRDGVGWLTSQGYRGQAVILPDSLKDWEIETGAKGASFWRLVSEGQAAHGSRIWDGQNAVEQLLKFVEVLRSNTTVEPCGDPAHLHSTLNLGYIQGGSTANQVPESAEAFVDLRLMPNVALAEVKSWMDAASAKVPGVRAEPLPMQNPASKLITTGPVKLFEEFAEEMIGRPLPHVLAHGGTDARWFAELNIPVITVGPRGGNPHGMDEWVDLEDLDRFYQVTQRFVEAWAKI